MVIMVINEIEQSKTLLFLKVMYFILSPSCFFPLSSPFHLHPKAPPVARFMNSGRLSGRQRRMMGK